ncbi:hypothetical protein F8271_22795 [Micromonospora sp. ALFpr18c]|nr:hypothetical protein F8271_22795 [Micromonospora sp. ALFpr18c]
MTTRSASPSHRWPRRTPLSFTLPDGTAWSPCTDPGDGPQVEGTVVDPVPGAPGRGRERRRGALGRW